MSGFRGILLLFIGLIIAVAGFTELLQELSIITVNQNIFGALIVLLIGCWIIAVGIVRRVGYFDHAGKA
jgi:hypothetical protein